VSQASVPREAGTEVRLRAARPGDAEALARLNLRTALFAYRDIFPPEAPVPVHDDMVALWDGWLGPGHALGWRAFVAETGGGEGGGEVVGSVACGPDPDPGSDPDRGRGEGHMARLNVAPERWAGGIGRRLYDAAMGSMTDAGFPAATLWVLEHNTRARRWYERLGWHLSGARKVLFAPGGIVDVGYRIALPAREPGPPGT
jgi:ribosomal protein S18 acetylase RimI-like enzyme